MIPDRLLVGGDLADKARVRWRLISGEGQVFLAQIVNTYSVDETLLTTEHDFRARSGDYTPTALECGRLCLVAICTGESIPPRIIMPALIHAYLFPVLTLPSNGESD
jgi:hypothetical protein